MPQIEFTHCGYSHRGSFSAGDVWTVSEEEAGHFVDEAKAAKRVADDARPMLDAAVKKRISKPQRGSRVGHDGQSDV